MLNSQKLLEFFKRRGEPVSFKKRSILVAQDAPLDSVYLITKGYVKVYDIDSTGAQRIISIFAPSHVLPISWLTLPPDTEALYFYAAMSQVECYQVPVAELEDLLNDPAMCRFIMDILVRAYINHASRIQNLESSHAAERIKFILYYLVQRLGTTVRDDVASLPVVITQQEIADLTGVARETVTIELRHLAQQGIYRREKGMMYINLDKLDVQSMPKIYGLQYFKDGTK
jgi:CRP/FNR family transcriptional regulator